MPTEGAGGKLKSSKRQVTMRRGRGGSDEHRAMELDGESILPPQLR